MAISRTTTLCSLVILAALSITSVNVNALSPAPAPAPGPGTASSDCMTLIYNMSDCLTYVEQGSNSTKPDKGCCPELAGMLDNKPICLCQLLRKSNDFPVELDLNRAFKLPSVCGLQTLPLSMCSAAGIPVGAPTSSEGPSSGISPGAGEGVNPTLGSSNANCNIAYLSVTLAMTLASLLTL